MMEDLKLDEPLLGGVIADNNSVVAVKGYEVSVRRSTTSSSFSSSAAAADDDDCTTIRDQVICFIILPIFYIIQYALLLSLNPTSSHYGISWFTVNISVILFIGASYLYRVSLRELSITNDIFVLLPEIAMDISLVCLLFEKSVLAMLIVLSSVIIQSLFVIIMNLRYMIFLSPCTKDIVPNMSPIIIKDLECDNNNDYDDAPPLLVVRV